MMYVKIKEIIENKNTTSLNSMLIRVYIGLEKLKK